jgi:hypothetical protein
MNEDTVRELARAADLPLSDERLALVAPQLRDWLAAANELNQKLAAEAHRQVVPITTFRHPPPERKEQ